MPSPDPPRRAPLAGCHRVRRRRCQTTSGVCPTRPTVDLRILLSQRGVIALSSPRMGRSSIARSETPGSGNHRSKPRRGDRHGRPFGACWQGETSPGAKRPWLLTTAPFGAKTVHPSKRCTHLARRLKKRTANFVRFDLLHACIRFIIGRLKSLRQRRSGRCVPMRSSVTSAAHQLKRKYWSDPRRNRPPRPPSRAYSASPPSGGAGVSWPYVRKTACPAASYSTISSCVASSFGHGRPASSV